MVTRSVRVLSLWMTIVCTGLLAQEAESQPAFEVVSVKPVAQASVQSGASVIGSRQYLRGITIADLLARAFKIQPDQVKGPSWLFSDGFDISAVAPPDTPGEKILPMFQQMLLERFGLQYHRELINHAAYALVAGPEASRIPAGIPDEDPGNLGPLGPLSGGGSTGAPLSIAVRAPFGIYRLSVVDGVNRYAFQNISMQDFAQYLSQIGRASLGAPVHDATKMTGRYQVLMEIPQAEMHGGAAHPANLGSDTVPTATDPPGVSMRASLQKQGLRLERRTFPVEMFVVDRIEKTPKAN